MFGQASISDAYKKIAEDLRVRILKEQDSFILGTDTSRLVEYYFAENHLEPIKIDTERTETYEHKKEVRTVRARQREHGYQDEGDLDFEFESIIVKIPIIPNEFIIPFRDLSTSTSSMSWSPKETIYGTGYIGFVIEIKGYGFDRENQVEPQVQFQKNRIYEWISRVADDTEKENNLLKDYLRQIIAQGKSKLEADGEKIATIMRRINIPLAKKEDEATKRIQLSTKPLISRIRPTPKIPEEYLIDRDKVLDIIKIVDNQGRQFEKTPKSFQNSGEEDLRNIFLVNLNTVFEGKATGETFLANGKTDIYLNIDKGNILVSECKIWAGQKVYSETIDQLLSYLTWRENFGILITFAKIKSFSKVLLEAETTIQSHLSYKDSFHHTSKTHFISRHALPSDDAKKVEVHHLFYNLCV